MNKRAEAVRSVVTAVAGHRVATAELVRQASARVEAALGALGPEVVARLRSHAMIGSPPPFLRIAGAGRTDLEKPFNRLLAWWADTAAEHGLAREFLIELARAVRFEVLEEDLRSLLSDGRLQVYSEEPPDGGPRQPDLVVMTKRAVLLLENKVYSPESGDQYPPYLERLAVWARGRKAMAVLCARDQRQVPKGWDGAMTHMALAAVFCSVAASAHASAWGRVAALITAAAFEDRGPAGALAEARALLERKSPTPAEVGRMLGLLRALEAAAVEPPWSERG
jgi:hypothetical protein